MGIREEAYSRETPVTKTTNERGIPHAASSNANEASKGRLAYKHIQYVVGVAI